MALLQIFFFPYFGNTIATIGLRLGLGNRNFGNVITEIQNFLSHFFSFSLIFLLNFSNTIAEIHSLSSIS